MAQVDIIIGILVTIGILLWLSFKFKEHNEHQVLQIAFVLISLALLVLIPKVYVQFNETCYPVVANSSSVGGLTTYDYEEFCVTKTTTTPTSFFKIILYTVRIIYAYLIIYFLWVNWEMFNLLYKALRNKFR